ncbi:MAG: hypothetical protein Q7R61_00685 [bacterium]|nr:hypothetical protein [bacterium]
MATGEGKFVRIFGHREVHITACAVTKNVDTGFLLAMNKLANYFVEPNQFWKRDPNHERALLKIYKRDPEDNAICQETWLYDDDQILKIWMPFLGHNSNDGWGELQFLIKEPAKVKLARNRSFDTRVGRWVKETKLIQPKTDLGTHAYLALRFYHQDYLPPVPGDWRFEPVYVSVRNSDFYKTDVLWEREKMTVTVTKLSKDSPEIPKHLK